MSIKEITDLSSLHDFVTNNQDLQLPLKNIWKAATNNGSVREDVEIEILGISVILTYSNFKERVKKSKAKCVVRVIDELRGSDEYPEDSVISFLDLYYVRDVMPVFKQMLKNAVENEINL